MRKLSVVKYVDLEAMTASIFLNDDDDGDNDWCVATIRRSISYKTFINKQIRDNYDYNNKAGTVYSWARL